MKPLPPRLADRVVYLDDQGECDRFAWPLDIPEVSSAWGDQEVTEARQALARRRADLKRVGK